MFTPDDAARLEGPDWLRQRRIAAAEQVAATSLPTTAEEIWRYSRIGELDLDRFAPASEDGNAGTPPAAATLLEQIRPAGCLVLRDGRVVRRELAPDLAEAGVVLGPLAELDDGADVLGSVAGDSLDVFGTMNDAYAAEPVVVRVPKGVVVERPFVVVNWIAHDGAAVLPRLVVKAAADSEVTVLDWLGSDDVTSFVAPVVELDAGPAARLRYLGVQELGQRVWHIGSQLTRADQDATTLSSMVALGGDYARVRADSRLTGRGATGDLLAVYFGEADQMHDFRTFQDHHAPDTTSNLVFKGAVQDRARSVYTGLIRVRPEARGTNAFQTNRNIKLSEQAWAESVPNLEIENNDVRCSHASAVGPVDENQRFYLESRGVPPPIAERLIVIGFFDDVLERLPVPELRVPLRRRRRQARPEGRRLMAEDVRLCAVDDVHRGSAKRFDVGRHRICLVRIDDDFYAIGDTCTHAEISLSEGEVYEETREIECWKHGSTFSLVTGEPLSLPATKAEPVYRVKVSGDDVVVTVP